MTTEPKAFTGDTRPSENLVRSVQRMRLPEGRDAQFAAEEYMRFLPARFRGLVRVDISPDKTCSFHLGAMKRPLLVLRYAPERSGKDRQLFYVTAGLLVRKTERPRFELRQALDGRTLLAAIHEFSPRLPWYVYIVTQAVAHAFVMWLFARHLARIEGVHEHPSAKAVAASS